MTSDVAYMTSTHVRVVEENVALVHENARLAQENEILRLQAVASAAADDTSNIWGACTWGHPMWSAPPGLSPEPATNTYFDAPAGSMLKAAAWAQWAQGDTQLKKKKGQRNAKKDSFEGRVPATISLDTCKCITTLGSKTMSFTNSFASTAEPTNSFASAASTDASSNNDAGSGASGSGAEEEVFEQRTPPPAEAPPAPPKTTVMMRNLPKQYTRDMLLSLMDSEGFIGAYDFIYLPIDFLSSACFGYAFINFVSHAEAERFRMDFQGFSKWDVSCDKICDVAWSDIHQGLNSHIDRYRSSPVMHEDMPDECKPAVFADGARVAFPAPLKKIRAPRIRHR